MPFVNTPLMQARNNESLHGRINTLKLWFPCTESNGETVSDTQSGIIWAPGDEADSGGACNITFTASGNTITHVGLNSFRNFTGYIVGEQFTISGGTGDTGLRGTYTVASVTSGTVVVVDETVTDGSLSNCTLTRLGSRGRLQFDPSLRTVIPAMPAGTSGGATTRQALPTSPRSGTLPTIEAGKSFLFMYVARNITDATPTEFEANQCRLALGDINGALGANDTGLGMAGVEFHTAVQDDSSDLIRTSMSVADNLDYDQAGKDIVTYFKYTHGVGVEHKSLDLSDYSTLVETDGATDATGGFNMADVTLGDVNYIRSNGLGFYGIALYTFDAVPDDIDYAIKWQGWAWKNGYRIPYPNAVTWE